MMFYAINLNENLNENKQKIIKNRKYKKQKIKKI